MFEEEALYINFEKIDFSYNDYFEKFNIDQDRRIELCNKDILFVPSFYRGISEPCFTEGLSTSIKIIKDELNIQNVDLCMNEYDSYKEFHMHSALFFLGTIVSSLALGVLTNLISDLLKKQFFPSNDDILNVTIIKPEINIKIEYNGKYEDLEKIPEQFQTYSKMGIKKRTIDSTGKIIDVTA